MGSVLVRLCHSPARVKDFGAQHPLGAEIWSSKKVHIEISVITRPKFTKILLPNTRGIAVDQETRQFWISSSVSEIFTAELWSHTKSGANFPCFWPLNFLGKGPFEILNRNYKIEHTSEYRAKFCGDWLMELGDYARGKNKGQQNISPRKNYRFRAD